MRLFAVLGLVCLVALVPAAGLSQSTQQTTGLVRIFSFTQGVASTDIGIEGRSAGDRFFQGLLLSDRRGNVIGHGAVICTFLGKTLPSPVSQCLGNYILPLGKLVASGTRQRRDYYLLAVVGGTGVYSQARGTLIVSTVAMSPRKERLLFSLE